MSCKHTGKTPGADTNFWVPVWQPNISYPEGALVAYLDYAPTLNNPLEDITIEVGPGSQTVFLYNTFADIDDDDISIVATSSNTSLVQVSVLNAILTLNYEPDQLGVSTITVVATSNEKSITDTFTVTVTAVDLGPEVINGLPDITVDEDAVQGVIDLSNPPVFSDPEGDPIELWAVSTNYTLVEASIDGSILTLDYQPNQNGTAGIIIHATANGKSVQDTFAIVVNAIADDPIVVSPVDDFSVLVDANYTTIDLSNVFEDPDGGALTFGAQSSDTLVVAATITNDNILLLYYLPDRTGPSTITVTATNPVGAQVVDEFLVTVNPLIPEITSDNGQPTATITVDEGHTGAVTQVTATGGGAMVYSFLTDDPSDSDLFTMAADGTITFNTTPDFEAPLDAGADNGYVFIVKAENENGSDTQAITVNVVNVDEPPVVANPIPDIGLFYIDEFRAEDIVDLTNVFADVDNEDGLITKSASSSDTNIVTVDTVGNTLTLTYPTPGTETNVGQSTITVTAESNMLTVDDDFEVEVLSPCSTTLLCLDNNSSPLQDLSSPTNPASLTVPTDVNQSQYLVVPGSNWVDTSVSQRAKYDQDSLYFAGNYIDPGLNDPDRASYISVPNSHLQLHTHMDWTIETWIYISSTYGSHQYPVEDYMSIFTHGEFPLLSLYKDTGATAHLLSLTLVPYGGTDIEHSTNINLDTWYHVAAVKENENFTLYVEGMGETEVVPGVSSGLPDEGYINAYIGSTQQAGGYQPFMGNMESFRISSRSVYHSQANFTPPAFILPTCN